MKRCPECARDYNDDSLSFCLDDGSELLFGPASGSAANDEPATAILRETASPNEAVTRAKILTTEQTAVLPSGITEVPKAKRFDKRLIVAPLALAIIVLGGIFGYKYLSPTTKQINSIAVMPFENRNSDADTDYLSDGLAESLIYRLSQLPDLKVSPTSSVFRYKGKESDPQTVAKELGVDSVMTGRITQRGDNLNISVNLVDARSNKSLWGEQYERKLSELLTTQREIVGEIVSKLQVKLSGESEQKLAKNYTDNPEAYQLYLQGRFHWNKRDTKEFEKAIVFFNRAIDIDPNFALAYSGLADSLDLMPIFDDELRPKDFRPRAKQAALKALEVDPNLAEAHASLGRILYDYEYDFAGAERSFKRAIELDPNYASAHQWYSDLLSVSSRHDEAVREITKAVELDPYSEIINWVMPEILRRAGRVEEANVRFTKLKELIPNESPRRSWVVFSDFLYNLTGKNVWEVEGQTSFATARVEPEDFAKLKEAYEKGGWDRYWRMRQQLRVERLNSKQENEPNSYVRAIDYAIAYSLGRDKDKTIEYLNRAYDERPKYMLELNVDKTWDSVRDDPRFKELVRRVGIPE